MAKRVCIHHNKRNKFKSAQEEIKVMEIPHSTYYYNQRVIFLKRNVMLMLPTQLRRTLVILPQVTKERTQ
jgi:hypothetical protein